MESPGSSAARAYLVESRAVLDACLADEGFAASLESLAATLTASLRQGGKLLIAGNGGSAGDAQHMAAEFLSRLNYDRAPLPALALTTDTSVLTAIGNDYGFDSVFSRQVTGLGRRGDVFLGISTSGRSPNILKALQAARAGGLVTVGFTAEGPRQMDALCDHVLKSPTPVTAMAQQIHIIAAHVVCGLVETALFPPAKA